MKKSKPCPKNDQESGTISWLNFINTFDNGSFSSSGEWAIKIDHQEISVIHEICIKSKY